MTTTATVRCGWTPNSEDWVKYPEACALHTAPGHTIGECDSIVCSCGNAPHLDGFYPVARDGEGWSETEPKQGIWTGEIQCYGCGAVFTEDGTFVEIAPIRLFDDGVDSNAG